MRAIEADRQRILAYSAVVEGRVIPLQEQVLALKAELNVAKGSFDAFAQQVCDVPACNCGGPGHD